MWDNLMNVLVIIYVVSIQKNCCHLHLVSTRSLSLRYACLKKIREDKVLSRVYETSPKVTLLGMQCIYAAIKLVKHSS